MTLPPPYYQPAETHVQTSRPGWGSGLRPATAAQLTGPPGAPTFDLGLISTALLPPEPTRLLKYESAVFPQFPMPLAEVLMNRQGPKSAVGEETDLRKPQTGWSTSGQWWCELWCCAYKTHPPSRLLWPLLPGCSGLPIPTTPLCSSRVHPLDVTLVDLKPRMSHQLQIPLMFEREKVKLKSVLKWNASLPNSKIMHELIRARICLPPGPSSADTRRLGGSARESLHPTPAPAPLESL